MSRLTPNPASSATSAHRAQIVAEAVASAYVHEIAFADRPRERAGAILLTPAPRREKAHRLAQAG